MLVKSLRTGKYFWRNAEITSEEYNSILARIRAKPAAPEGYEYQLSDDFEWTLRELPPDDGTEEELSAEDALNIILGGDEF